MYMSHSHQCQQLNCSGMLEFCCLLGRMWPCQLLAPGSEPPAARASPCHPVSI